MMRASRPCPFCGGLVVRDDAAQSIAHAEPECDEFKKAAESVGPHEVRHVRAEAIGAHFGALASRVRAKARP